jgi:hypothetical protein
VDRGCPSSPAACWLKFTEKLQHSTSQHSSFEKQYSRFTGYSYWWGKAQTVVGLCPFNTTRGTAQNSMMQATGIG